MVEKSRYDVPVFRLGMVLILAVGLIGFAFVSSSFVVREAPVAELPAVGAPVIAIQVDYGGVWSGSYGGDGTVNPISGTGARRITVEDAQTSVSASIQKQDDAADTLTVQILKNGAVVAEGSTVDTFGTVEVAYRIR